MMTPRPKIWLELAAGGWPVGQDMRILTSQPGNWNGWIFCNHGDGATVVLYTVYITYIHIPPRQCPLSNYDMLPLQPGT